MRHGKRFNHLGRTAPHRKAMLSNMASSLIMHKRISTTVAKAKALRQYVEPLLTKAKNDTTHSRRIVFSYLQDKESLRELFDVVSEKISNRPGGYTRIIKTGTRLGDSAEMCIMELVDYNELLLEDKETKKTRTRRGSRRRKKSTAKDDAAASAGGDQKVAEKEAVEEQQTEEQEEKTPEAAEQQAPDAKAEQKAETEVAKKEDDAGKAVEDKEVKASKKESADVPDQDPSGQEKKEDKADTGDQDKK